MIYKNPYPWENMKKFKLPIHKRLLLILLPKKDRKEIKERIEKINKIRIEEEKRKFKESRPKIRPLTRSQQTNLLNNDSFEPQPQPQPQPQVQAQREE